VFVKGVHAVTSCIEDQYIFWKQPCYLMNEGN